MKIISILKYMGRGDTPRPVEGEGVTAPEIVLTTDAELFEKLKRKAEEYGARAGFTAPEVNLHGTYKRDILKALLTKGKVNAAELGQELKERYGTGFSAEAFKSAYLIVQKYNSGSLEGVRGGTGLK